MEYLKVSFDDIDGLNEGLDIENYKQIILDEVKHLEIQGVSVIKHDIDNDFIIVNKIENLENILTYFNIITITECNQDGKSTSQKNTLEIKNVKYNIIVNYLRDKGVSRFNPVLAKNYITFSCPLCHKNNMKMCICINGFKVITFSENDCTDENHQKTFAKWTKELTNIWNASKEKKFLVYNLNMVYVKKIIEENFPIIVRHKSTNLLFRYDEKLKHYVEMQDNTICSDLESLIYKSFFNDNNDGLTIKQMRDMKQFIVRSYPFKVSEFEDSSLFNLQNGVYDIKLKELYKHSSKYFFNYCSNVVYDPKADPETLNNFLKEVICEDDPIILTQRILGHIHYDGIKLHKGFIFEGTKHGRNGKGTFVKLLVKTLGLNRTLTMSLDNFFDSNFYKYELKDKILYIEDDYKKEYITEKEIGFLNKLIGGANEQVQQKNKPSITIDLKAVPIIQCNKRIKLKASDDGGFYKRWVVVNFKNEYGSNDVMDEFLGEKLLNDKNVMSTMFNYMVKGYEAVIQRKESNIKGSFFKKDEVSHVEEWRKENNSVISFFEDCVDINSMVLCSTRELYNYYEKHWNLKSAKLSERNFVIQVKEELNLTTRRVWMENKTKLVTCFEGCCFIPEYDTESFKYNKIIDKKCNMK